MSDTSTEPSVPNDYMHDDVLAVVEYRSVSGFAVAAATFGVCSLAALLNSSLLFFPLLGIIFALWALARIARSEGQLVGRTAAITGLALSLTIGSAILVRGWTLDRLATAEASEWGIDWCQLVMDGELVTALELKNSPTARHPLDDTLADFYATDESAATALEEFEADPVIQLLASAPDDARIELGNLLATQRQGGGRYGLLQEFRIVDPGDESETKFRLELRRVPLRNLGGGAWYVANYALPE